MSISRWDPFSDAVTLRDAMDTLLRESFVRKPEGATRSGTMAMPMDVRETDDHFEIKAPLPGISPDEVDLQIRDNTIQITDESHEESTDKEDGEIIMRE